MATKRADPVPDAPPAVVDSPQDPPPLPVAAEVTPPAPAQAPAQTPPAPTEPVAPLELTDEQVIAALRDPRAQAILQYAYPSETPPSSPPALPYSGAPGTPDLLSEMDRLATEGDVAGISQAVAAERQRQQAAESAHQAGIAAQSEARRQMLGELAKVPELQDLSASQQIKLLNALNQGDASFITAAAEVMAEKRGSPQRAEASAAAAAAAGAVQAQPGLTPDLPGAQPSVEGPPVPEGEAARTKSGYDVLSEYFAWEDNQQQAGPPAI